MDSNLIGIARYTKALCQNARDTVTFTTFKTKGKKSSFFWGGGGTDHSINEALCPMKDGFILLLLLIFLSSHFSIWDTLLFRLPFMPTDLVNHCYLVQTKHLPDYQYREVLAFSCSLSFFSFNPKIMHEQISSAIFCFPRIQGNRIKQNQC